MGLSCKAKVFTVRSKKKPNGSEYPTIYVGINTNSSNYIRFDKKPERYSEFSALITWDYVLSEYTQLLNQYMTVNTNNIYSKLIIKCMRQYADITQVFEIYRDACEYRQKVSHDRYSTEFHLANKLCNTLEQILYGIDEDEHNAIASRRMGSHR